MTSRRDFVKLASAATVSGMVLGRTAQAMPLGLPLGIQLFSVREQLKTDYAGTLAAVGAAGYREVEAAGFYDHPIEEVKQALAAANLRCTSSHYPSAQLNAKFDEILAFNKSLGVEYLICSSPGKSPASANTDRRTPLTLDDWKWNAEQFNAFGAKTAAQGIKFGYHNHTPEFTVTDGQTPHEVLMANTDPAKVTFELDCGWAYVAKVDVPAYLRKHAARISQLHVKDFKMKELDARGEPKVTEMGRGDLDYGPVFRAAAAGHNIRHIYVEQEAFDMPWKDSLKVDADYMAKFKG